MRKISSHKNYEKKRKRNNAIMGIFLVFIMFFSVIGYGFQLIGDSGQSSNPNEAETLDYNGFTFTKQNNFWILVAGENSFIFSHNPNEVPKLNSELKKLEHYVDMPLYIYSEHQGAESEIRTNLSPFVERVQNACISNENCEGNLPVKGCSDNFIIIQEGNQEIKQEGNCVYITGNQEDLQRLSDTFLFNIFEIN